MGGETATKSKRNFIKTLGVGVVGLIVGGGVSYSAREAEVSSLRGQVDTLTKERSGLRTQVSTLRGQVETLTREKSGLETQVKDVSGRLSRLRSVKGDRGDRLFTFVVFNKAKTVDGVDHRINMNGQGWFNPEKREVHGGGNFLHFDNAKGNPAAKPPIPRPILAGGRWEAKRFLSYKNLSPPGIYSRVEASVVEMEVTLIREVPSPAEIPAILRVNCNIGVAGIATGEPEGAKLTIPGTPFAEGGAAGPFVALAPPSGLTHTSVAEA